METKLRKLVLFVLLSLLAGCATTPKADLGKFGGYNFPHVTLIFTSESLQYIEPRSAFLAALRESRAFASIDVSNPYAEYALEINIEFFNKVDSIGEAAATGALLGTMVIPVKMEYQVSGDVKLRMNEEIIDVFPVEFVHSRVQNLFQGMSKDGGWSGALRVAAQKIIENLKLRNSFNRLSENVEFESPSTLAQEI